MTTGDQGVRRRRRLFHLRRPRRRRHHLGGLSHRAGRDRGLPDQAPGGGARRGGRQARSGAHRDRQGVHRAESRHRARRTRSPPTSRPSCSTRLSAHEYPREVAFIDEMPMTTTGKVIRRLLRDQGLTGFRVAAAQAVAQRLGGGESPRGAASRAPADQRERQRRGASPRSSGRRAPAARATCDRSSGDPAVAQESTCAMLRLGQQASVSSSTSCTPGEKRANAFVVGDLPEPGGVAAAQRDGGGDRPGRRRISRSIRACPRRRAP